MKYRYAIELPTYTKVLKLVKIAHSIKGDVLLKSKGFVGNAKSVLNCLSCINWDDLYIESDISIYDKIKDFVKG